MDEATKALNVQAKADWATRGLDPSLYSLDRMLDIWSKEEQKSLATTRYTSSRNALAEQNEEADDGLERKLELIDIKKNTDIELKEIKQGLKALNDGYIRKYGSSMAESVGNVVYKKLVPGFYKHRVEWKEYEESALQEKQRFHEEMQHKLSELKSYREERKQLKLERKKLEQRVEKILNDKVTKENEVLKFKQQKEEAKRDEERESVEKKFEERRVRMEREENNRVLAEEMRLKNQRIEAFKILDEINRCELEHTKEAKGRLQRSANKSIQSSIVHPETNEGSATRHQSFFMDSSSLNQTQLQVARLTRDFDHYYSLHKKTSDELDSLHSEKQGLDKDIGSLRNKVDDVKMELKEANDDISRAKRRLKYPLKRSPKEEEMVILDTLHRKRSCLEDKLQVLDRQRDAELSSQLKEVCSAIYAKREELKKITDQKLAIENDLDSKLYISGNKGFSLPIVIGEPLYDRKKELARRQKIVQQSKIEILKEHGESLKNIFKCIKILGKKGIALRKRNVDARWELEDALNNVETMKYTLAKLNDNKNRKQLVYAIHKYFEAGGMKFLKPPQLRHANLFSGEIDFYCNRLVSGDSREISEELYYNKETSGFALRIPISIRAAEEPRFSLSTSCFGFYKLPSFRLWKIRFRYTEIPICSLSICEVKELKIGSNVNVYIGQSVDNMKFCTKLKSEKHRKKLCKTKDQPLTFEMLVYGGRFYYRLTFSVYSSIDLQELKQECVGLSILKGTFEQEDLSVLDTRSLNTKNYCLSSFVLLERLVQKQGKSKLELLLQEKSRLEEIGQLREELNKDPTGSKKRENKPIFVDSELLNTFTQRFEFNEYVILVNKEIESALVSNNSQQDLHAPQDVAKLPTRLDRKLEASKARLKLRKTKGMENEELVSVGKSLIGKKIEFFCVVALRWQIGNVLAMKVIPLENNTRLQILHEVKITGSDKKLLMNVITDLKYFVIGGENNDNATSESLQRRRNQRLQRYREMQSKKLRILQAKNESQAQRTKAEAVGVKDYETSLEESRKKFDNEKLEQEAITRDLAKRLTNTKVFRNLVQRYHLVKPIQEGFKTGSLTEDGEEINIGKDVAGTILKERFVDEFIAIRQISVKRRKLLNLDVLSSREAFRQRVKQQGRRREIRNELARHGREILENERRRKQRVETEFRTEFAIEEDYLTSLKEFYKLKNVEQRCLHRKIKYGSTAYEKFIHCLDCKKNLVQYYKDRDQTYQVSADFGIAVDQLRSVEFSNSIPIKWLQDINLSRKRIEKRAFVQEMFDGRLPFVTIGDQLNLKITAVSPIYQRFLYKKEEWTRENRFYSRLYSFRKRLKKLDEMKLRLLEEEEIYHARKTRIEIELARFKRRSDALEKEFFVYCRMLAEEISVLKAFDLILIELHRVEASNAACQTNFNSLKEEMTSVNEAMKSCGAQVDVQLEKYNELHQRIDQQQRGLQELQQELSATEEARSVWEQELSHCLLRVSDKVLIFLGSKGNERILGVGEVLFVRYANEKLQTPVRVEN